MKTKNLKLFPLSLAISLLALSSCDMIRENVNPEGEKSGFKYQVFIFQNDSGSALDTCHLKQVTFDTGTLRVNQIKFEAKKESEKLELKRQQQTTIDLVSRIADPPLPTIDLEPGTYNKIEFGVGTDGASEGPVLLVSGTITNASNDKIPYRYELDEEFDFKAEFKESVSMEEAQTSLARIKLTRRNWIRPKWTPRVLLSLMIAPILISIISLRRR